VGDVAGREVVLVVGGLVIEEEQEGGDIVVWVGAAEGGVGVGGVFWGWGCLEEEGVDDSLLLVLVVVAEGVDKDDVVKWGVGTDVAAA